MRHHTSALPTNTGIGEDMVGDVVEPLVLDADRRLSDVLTACSARGYVDFVSVCASVTSDLRSALRSLVELPMVDLFHRFRSEHGFPADRFAASAMKAFRLQGNTAERLFDAFPVLEQRVRATVSDRIRQVSEVVSAFHDDRGALLERALVGDADLVAIECTHGDPHAGGRRVAMVRVGSRTIVYKPRPFGPDALLADVIALVDPDEEYGLLAPRFLAGEDYGWQEFVDHRPLPPADPAGSARRFHERLGRLLAVFAALGSTDMHVENIVAHGEFPVPVDLETLVHPTTEPGAECGTEADKLAAALCDGPFGTSMLPSGDDAVSGTSIAALSDAGVRTVDGASSFAVSNAGTDGVAIERVAVNVPMFTHRPHRDGTPIGLGPYIDDVLRGYREMTSTLKKSAPQMNSLLDTYGDVEFRRVVRPTAVYTAFLDAAAHPRYLGNEGAREKLFAMLAPSVAGGEEGLALELDALRRGDVPRFVASARSRRFRSAGADSGSVLAPVFDTALQRAERCVGRTEKTPWVALEHAVRSALSAVAGQAGPTPMYPDLRAALAAENPTTSSARVSRRLAARAVRGDDGVPLGLVQSFPSSADAEAAVLVSSDRSLYHGGGASLLASQVASTTGSAIWRRRVRASVTSLLDDVRASRAAIERGDPVDPCPFTGSLGAAWMLGAAARAVDDPQAATEAHTAGALILAAALDNEDLRFDVVGGISGACALLACETATNSSVLERCADMLASEITRRLNANVVVRGFAHGVDGLVWALSRVDTALGRGDHTSALERLLELGSRPSSDPRNAGGSWCWGSTGILLAHAEIALALGDRRRAGTSAGEIADVAVDHDDSICHGDAGVVLSIAHLGVLLADVDLRAAARERADNAAKRIAQRGYRTGHGGSVATLSFMTGVPGIAYARAVASDPRLSNPVALTYLR